MNISSKCRISLSWYCLFKPFPFITTPIKPDCFNTLFPATSGDEILRCDSLVSRFTPILVPLWILWLLVGSLALSAWTEIRVVDSRYLGCGQFLCLSLEVMSGRWEERREEEGGEGRRGVCRCFQRMVVRWSVDGEGERGEGRGRERNEQDGGARIVIGAWDSEYGEISWLLVLRGVEGGVSVGGRKPLFWCRNCVLFRARSERRYWAFEMRNLSLPFWLSHYEQVKGFFDYLFTVGKKVSRIISVANLSRESERCWSGNFEAFSCSYNDTRSAFIKVKSTWAFNSLYYSFYFDFEEFWVGVFDVSFCFKVFLDSYWITRSYCFIWEERRGVGCST